jgi:hypothetical protein
MRLTVGAADATPSRPECRLRYVGSKPRLRAFTRPISLKIFSKSISAVPGWNGHPSEKDRLCSLDLWIAVG